jgi:hypothetical protein
MWQEKNNCINSAPECVCKLNLFKLRVCFALCLICLWRISEMLLNLWQFFMKWFLCAKKLPGLFLCNLQLFDMLKKTTL